MNTAFDEVIAGSDRDRGALFAETATRLGTAIQNIEKDFWVCWTLDALFNGLDAGSPRLLFKGGTSLSKAFHLIDRFSEDIDITVFREDIGQAIDQQSSKSSVASSNANGSMLSAAPVRNSSTAR